MIIRATRSLRVGCRLDQPRLNDCALTLKTGRRTLATGQANAGSDHAGATITLKLTKRARKLARRPGGLAADPAATATQTSGPDLHATIPLLLLPSAVVNAPTDGLFATGTAKLPARRNPLPAPPARPDHRRQPDHLHRPHRRSRQHPGQQATRPARAKASASS